MTWIELKKRIYFEDGSLRDIYILDTNVDDLRKWTDLVNEKYDIEFFDAQINLRKDRLYFKAIEETWTEENREMVTATIKMGAIKINCYFYGYSEITNDIDPREFKSFTEHEYLIKYLKDVSNSLDKEVIVTGENSKDSILIKVKDDKVILTSR